MDLGVLDNFWVHFLPGVRKTISRRRLAFPPAACAGAAILVSFALRLKAHLSMLVAALSAVVIFTRAGERWPPFLGRLAFLENATYSSYPLYFPIRHFFS